MAEWVSNGYQSWIADLGPYSGPWPVLAPGKLAPIRGKPFVEVNYITAIPDSSGDPTQYTSGESNCWITFATRGTTFDGQDYLAPYYSRYASGPDWATFTRDESTPFAGIHLFVAVRGDMGSSTPPDPLAFVPPNYVAGGYGAHADPGGKWSPWLPGLPTPIRVFDGFTNIANWTMRSAHIDYTGAAGDSWPTVIAHARSMLFDSLAAGNVTRYTSSLPLLERTSRAGFIHNPDGTKRCLFHAYQSAYLLLGTYYGDPKLRSIRPVNYFDYIPLDNNVRNYGASDPYTLNGDGYQYDPALEPVPLHFVDNSDHGSPAADGFLTGRPTSTTPIPHLPQRISAHPSPWGPANRVAWLTGTLYPLLGTWFADDPGAIVIGDLDLDPGPGSDSDFVNPTTLTRRYSLVEGTPDIWLVCQPSFALPSGPDPEVPSWVVNTPGTAGSVYYASMFTHRTTNYDPSYGLSDISLSQQMPRWRYWIPAAGELGIRGSDRPPIIFW